MILNEEKKIRIKYYMNFIKMLSSRKREGTHKIVDSIGIYLAYERVYHIEKVHLFLSLCIQKCILELSE